MPGLGDDTTLEAVATDARERLSAALAALAPLGQAD